jgi:ERF superfamily
MSAVAVDVPTMWDDLVTALSELSELPRSRTANTGTYSYSYADLGDALSAVRPVLAKHHLAISQPVSLVEGVVRISTTLLHSSGQHFESPVLSFPAPPSPQAIGSVITYGRRYSLMATLGLGTDDDDGAAASSAPVRAAPAPPARTAPVVPDDPSKPSQSQANLLHGLLTKLHLSERDTKLRWVSEQLGREISSTSEVTRDETAQLIDVARALHESDPWKLPDDPAPVDEGYGG